MKKRNAKKRNSKKGNSKKRNVWRTMNKAMTKGCTMLCSSYPIWLPMSKYLMSRNGSTYLKLSSYYVELDT